jgi:hypothetical protein
MALPRVLALRSRTLPHHPPLLQDGADPVIKEDSEYPEWLWDVMVRVAVEDRVCCCAARYDPACAAPPSLPSNRVRPDAFSTPSQLVAYSHLAPH